MGTQLHVWVATLAPISTPDRIESWLGTLDFEDGVPADAAAQLHYDNLDSLQGVHASIDAFPGASTAAMRRGFHSGGVEDNSVHIFSDLMHSSSLFLAANCDTLYALSCNDVSNGAMVVEVPAMSGLPGPDRATGGHDLIIRPGYDGALPDGGYHISHSRSWRPSEIEPV